MYDDRRLEPPILRKALAVFINHAETLIERGGPVVLYSGRQKTFWPQLISAPTHAGAVQTPNVKPFKRRTP
jgi:hypothetical protein